MAKHQLKREQLTELLLQALETELGGVQVYENAVKDARNEDLKEEWEKYLDQTREHVEIVTELCQSLGVDPQQESPGRLVVRGLGEALVKAMQAARAAGATAAELVACECVTLAETKDHGNWELLAEAAKVATGEEKAALQEAVDQVEDQEDEHLYHTAGWTRELWMESLGLEAILPPPEERKQVKTAIGAARAKQQRAEM